MLVSQPCEPVLMFKSFLSVDKFACPYNIWHMLTFGMRDTRIADENILEGTKNGKSIVFQVLSNAAQQYVI